MVERSDSDAAATQAMPVRRARPRLVAAGLVALAFLVYIANGRLVSAGDNYPARYLPFGILKHRTLKLDPIAEVVSQGETHPHWCINKFGHTYSFYPVAAPILVTPLYIPAAAYLQWQGWTDERLDQIARLMEKLTSALIASLSVGMMYLLLVRRTDCRRPLLLTIAYGFGTNTWMISGQALWQHGMAELMVVIALYLVLGPCTRLRAVAMGFCLALIPAIRPPDALLAAPLGLFALRWAKGNVLPLLISCAIPVALLLSYNYKITHHIAGGYSTCVGADEIDYSIQRGILGLLFSPARGLFVFTPFLLFVPCGLYRLLRDPKVRGLATAVAAGMVFQLVLYAKLDWRAGCSWGPRWLTDMLPLLVWMLAAAIGSLRPVGLAAFLLAVGASIGVQAVGAFWYTGASDREINRQGGDPNTLPVVWEIHNAPFVAELRHGTAPRELFLETSGFIDRICVEDCDVEQIVPGMDLEIFGWALADRRTPNAVRVIVAPAGNTRWPPSQPSPTVNRNQFGDRPDVTETLQSQGPSGWQVVLKTDGLDPGLHRVEVKVQGHEGGEFRHVAQRQIEVLPAALESSAPIAARRLQQRQHREGYWLTSHTVSTNYVLPTPEMNVFLTAVIFDLLVPISKPGGFDPFLERARSHLREQIEPNGLVRYHGKTESSTIPALGRPITPDADDTALAWRIAGPKNDRRLADAMEVLKSYRDADGLYRTWLAPQKDYVSIDPGLDPNPADTTIQMHVLMLLSETDWDAAAALHRSLRPAIREDRTWAYYHRAPLIPIWRTGELQSLGYPLEIPVERMRSEVPGQEHWVEACRLLARYSAKGAQRPSPEETRTVLESLAKGDFAVVRHSPPLMYHNDLTAKCSRFYWSSDFGYALWLRLYHEMSSNPAMAVTAGVKR